MSKLELAAPKACSQCPWRLSNVGKRHPDGWYSKSNLKRLWSKLRYGDTMSCHPTDPNNPLPAGATPVPETAKTSECTGANILQHREFMKFQAIALPLPAGKGFVAYREKYPGGLTRDGLAAMVSRVMFGGVPVVGGSPMAKPDLADKEIGYEPLLWNAEIAKASRLKEN